MSSSSRDENKELEARETEGSPNTPLLAEHSPNMKRQKNVKNSKARPKRTARLKKHANENLPKRVNKIKGIFSTPK